MSGTKTKAAGVSDEAHGRLVEAVSKSKLAAFDGSPEMLDAWLVYAKRDCDTFGVVDELRPLFALQRLSSSLMVWGAGLDPVPQSWDEFCKALKKEVQRDGFQLRAQMQLLDVTQGSLTVNKYVEKFRLMERQVRACTKEQLLRSIFVHGLRAAIQEQVRQRDPDTLETAIGLASAFDPDLYARNSSAAVAQVEESEDVAAVVVRGTGARGHDNRGGRGFGGGGSGGRGGRGGRGRGRGGAGGAAPLSGVQCFTCHGFGHVRAQCPNGRALATNQGGQAQ
jgi:hypothetical protein